MVDLVDDEIKGIYSTVLEPACGTGNFLTEILKRKLETVFLYANTIDELEIYTCLAISTIYGVDIQMDNIYECKKRLFDLIMNTFSLRAEIFPSEKCKRVIKFILSIIRKDIKFES